jgi:hypothetical protein
MGLLDRLKGQPLDDDAFVLSLGELKPRMLKAIMERWRDCFGDLLTQRFGNPVVIGDESEISDFTDAFVLQHRLPDGRTPIEVYADETADLDDETRATLRRWKVVTHSLFEITGREGRRIDLLDLVSGARIGVRPNMVLPNDPFTVGQLFVARLVPVRDFFTFSGHTALVKPEARATVLGHFRRHGVRIANPRRFVLSPGSPAPSPKDTCPCGSGRRYKKCCMPR